MGAEDISDILIRSFLKRREGKKPSDEEVLEHLGETYTDYSLPDPDLSKANKLIRREMVDNISFDNIWYTLLAIKIRGMSMISQYLFSKKGYKEVLLYTKKLRDDLSPSELKQVERLQGVKFWKHAKVYANRLGIPYRNRIYHQANRLEIDVLNYRANIVGNMLRSETIRYIGTGAISFKRTKGVHRKLPTMDLIEPTRPMLYYLVLKTFSASERELRKYAREIINRYIRWLIEWIANYSLGLSLPRRPAYHEQIRELSQQLAEDGIIRNKVFVNKMVTREDRPGVITYQKQTKEARAGERIHARLLCEFAQPVRIIVRKYAQIMAEVAVNNNEFRGKVDILVLAKKVGNVLIESENVFLVADLKTHMRDEVQIDWQYYWQVNRYCRILADMGFETSSSHRLLIYVRRDTEIDSIKKYIDWISTDKEVPTDNVDRFDFGDVVLFHWS